ncbi:STAS domain-containing protein [Terasakiella sp. A23]|uniref:STAS domain-containing protein n=1 Tax=Terasakiella sp. FCG-A23 TaxID=3080561 RepID=UPI002954BB19|nr:STAS domain-containing protein [Terasakiella sp. A23]MDV7340356.1 STAS domain-containing protein [Terasakiella sp. A23]
MEISKEEIGVCLVLTPNGRIDSQSAPEFQSSVIGLIEGGQSRVVLDFSKIEYISSAGLRVVLMAAKRCKAAKGGFAMFALADHIKEVFEISGFLKILSVADDKDGAVQIVS